MQYTLYKGNAKNTGSLASFRIAKTKNKKDQWENVLFVEIVPQKGWNDSTKLATYNVEGKTVIAITVDEAGEFIHSFERNVPFNAFHKSQNATAVIKLNSRTITRKIDDTTSVEVLQYGLSVTKGGNKFWVSINAGEAEILKILLDAYIKQALALVAKNHDDDFKKKGDSAKAKPAPKQEEESNEQPAEEDDDIPF